MTAPLLLRCSPRAGGNSDTAANAFAQGVEQAGGSLRVLTLRDMRVAPCLGCGRCRGGRPCALAGTDDAQAVFEALLAAPFAVFASPIYFYHLPAGFKALIDRSQALYERREAGDPALAAPQRPAGALLVAGRPTGDKLFEGSLLTLKYFLKVFAMHLGEPGHLGFRGKDGPGDMAADAQALAQAQAYGAQAWRTWR